MNGIIGLANLIFLGFLFWKLSKKFDAIRPYYWPSLIFKMVSGVGIGILYSYYYSYGDTFTFFNKASALSDLFFEDSLAYIDYLINSSNELFNSGYESQPRALFFVKLTSFFCVITGNNYWLVSIYYSTISFLGALYLCNVLINKYYEHKWSIVFAFLFFPSAVFWTSGIIKESLAASVTFLLVAAVFHSITTKRTTILEVLVIVLSALVLWKIKYYYAGVLFITLISFMGSSLIGRFSDKIRSSKVFLTLVFFFICVCTVLLVTQLHPNLALDSIGVVIVKNYEAFAVISKSGDYIHFNDLNADLWSLVYHAPKAFFSGLLRPFLWETQGNIFKVLTSLENIFIFLLCVASLFHVKIIKNHQDYLAVLASLFFFVIMLTFLSLSAPNYGTLVRYKSVAMPFLVLVISLNHPYIKKLMKGKF